MTTSLRDQAYPAEIRSSRDELFRDTTHHCPKGELFKSINSALLKCVAYFLRATMASTRSCRASAKADNFISLAKVTTASPQTIWHRSESSTIDVGGGVPSHRKHVQLLKLPSFSRIADNERFAAQGNMPRYSKALQRSLSFNSAKQLLQTCQWPSFKLAI